MKQLMTAFLVVMITVTSFAQDKQEKKATDVISFTEMKHDFGKIKQGVPVNYDFVFKNTSNQPVVIESANASCGCTTPTWPKEPVMKNKTGKITTGFNAQNAGPFNKTITVKVAGIDIPLELKITGEVIKAENNAKVSQDTEKKQSK